MAKRKTKKDLFGFDNNFNFWMDDFGKTLNFAIGTVGSVAIVGMTLNALGDIFKDTLG